MSGERGNKLENGIVREEQYATWGKTPETGGIGPAPGGKPVTGPIRRDMNVNGFSRSNAR